MSYENEILQKIVDSSNATFYLKDEQGRYIFVNSHAAKRVNLKPEDFTGKTVYDYFPKEEADFLNAKEKEAREAGKPVHFKLNITTSKGKVAIINEIFPVSLDGHPYAIGGISFEINDIEE